MLRATADQTEEGQTDAGTGTDGAESNKAQYQRLCLAHGIVEGKALEGRIPLECNLDLLSYVHRGVGVHQTGEWGCIKWIGWICYL